MGIYMIGEQCTVKTCNWHLEGALSKQFPCFSAVLCMSAHVQVGAFISGSLPVGAQMGDAARQ